MEPVSGTMPETLTINSTPSVFSPLAKALLDGFTEGVVVFDVEGRLLYANQPAREALAGMDLYEGAIDLQPRLAALGGRLRPLRVGGLELGEAMFIPGLAGATTLAAREKEAIVKTLDAHGWKLAETARSLGISRTTLWGLAECSRRSPSALIESYGGAVTRSSGPVTDSSNRRPVKGETRGITTV